MKEMLLNKLKNCKKLVIMGIGNELTGDDAVGIYVVKELMRHFGEEKEFVNAKNLYLINAGTVPDFFTDILKEIKQEIKEKEEFNKNNETAHKEVTKKEEETAFKEYLHKLACDGVFNEELAVHVANFHKENKQ